MQDPMSFAVPTSGVSTKFPLMPEGDVKFQITESSYVAKMFGKEMLGWSPKLVTVDTQANLDPEGQPIPPNTRVFLENDFALEDGPDAKFPGSYIRTLCLAVDAIFGTDDTSRPNVNRPLLDSAPGRFVIGHVIIDEDKRDGTKRNKIKRLKAVTQ